MAKRDSSPEVPPDEPLAAALPPRPKVPALVRGGLLATALGLAACGPDENVEPDIVAPGIPPVPDAAPDSAPDAAPDAPPADAGPDGPPVDAIAPMPPPSDALAAPDEPAR